MIEAIRNFFDSHIAGTIADDGNSGELNADQRQLATAALLIEVASADQNVSDEELASIRSLLLNKFNLTEEQLNTLTELARAEQDEATSLYQFTQLINEQCGQEEKFRLVTAMWEVAFVDGNIDKYEEHLIRRVSDLIYLSHSDFIRAKMTAQQPQ